MVLVLEAVTDSGWQMLHVWLVRLSIVELTIVKLWNMMEVWIGWVTDFITYLNHAPCNAATAPTHLPHLSGRVRSHFTLHVSIVDPWKLKSWPLFSSCFYAVYPCQEVSIYNPCNGPIDECRVNINKLERAIHIHLRLKISLACSHIYIFVPHKQITHPFPSIQKTQIFILKQLPKP